MLSNPVAVSCVAYKCFVDRNDVNTDGAVCASNSVAVPDASAIMPTPSALQPIIDELRSLDTTRVLEQPMHVDEDLHEILSEPLRAALRHTLRSVSGGHIL